MKTIKAKIMCDGQIVLLTLVMSVAGPVPAALASNPASDDAAASAYDDGWETGDNGGYGFGAWTIYDVPAGGFAGHFLAATNPAAPAPDVVVTTLRYLAAPPHGEAWAMYATDNPRLTFQHVAAFRAFTDGTLATGQSFVVEMENGEIAPTGTVGFVLRTGNVANAATDYNVGARFELGFFGGSNNYFIVDGTSGGTKYFQTGIGWTTNGLRATFTLTGPNSYDLRVETFQPASTYNFSRTLSGSGGLQSVALYCRDVDVGGDPGNAYFNRLSVSAEPASPYTLLPSTQDSGGRRITNAAQQVMDASLGGPFGVLTNSAVQVAKIGYPAQLYDLTGLSVTALPPTVAEGDTRELLARYGYDDGSASPLPAGAAPTWAKLSGPLFSVTSLGDHRATALASNVYQHTPALARASYQSLTGNVSLTVLNTNWDNFYAYAGDGLDDRWQVDHFGFNSAEAGPEEDPDEDTQLNVWEWVANTDPMDDLSFLHFTVQRAVPADAGFDLKFWPVYPDTRTYHLLSATNLITDPLQVVSPATTSTVGEVRTVRDPKMAGSQSYGLRIEYEPDL